MGYRIYCSIVKQDKLHEYLSKKDFEIQSFDIESIECIELNENTPIDQFTMVEQTKEWEYPVYILNMFEFQKIIDFYRDFIIDDYKDKDKDMKMMQHFTLRYFESLKREDVNIKSSALFVFDYFYLVRILENSKPDEYFIITHG